MGIKETWVDVNCFKGFEGLYMVSSEGRIKRKSFNRTNVTTVYQVAERMMRPILKRNGYLAVDFSNNGKKTTISLHRIVAICFIENPHSKKCVNHKNSLRTDNRVINLEWATHKENSTHATMFGNTKKGKYVHNAKPVMDTVSGVKYDTLEMARLAIGKGQGNLSNMLNGKINNNTTLVWA